MSATIKKYAKFVVAAAGVATIVGTEVVATPDQDLSSPEGWVKVVLAVATALLVRRVPNSE